MHSHLVSRVEELAAERLRSFLLCVHSGKHVEAKLHYKGHMALYNKVSEQTAT
jgi:hypothetical protein